MDLEQLWTGPRNEKHLHGFLGGTICLIDVLFLGLSPYKVTYFLLCVSHCLFWVTYFLFICKSLL